MYLCWYMEYHIIIQRFQTLMDIFCLCGVGAAELWSRIHHLLCWGRHHQPHSRPRGKPATGSTGQNSTMATPWSGYSFGSSCSHLLPDFSHHHRPSGFCRHHLLFTAIRQSLILLLRPPSSLHSWTRYSTRTCFFPEGRATVTVSFCSLFHFAWALFF